MLYNMMGGAMVGPIQNTSLSSKFRKDNYKKQQMVKVFVEGDVWMEVLLAQLPPATEIAMLDHLQGPKATENGRFNMDEDLARLRFELKEL